MYGTTRKTSRRRIFIPNTYVEVPAKFSIHLREFKKIGKNVFKIAKNSENVQSAAELKKILADAMHKDPKVTVIDALRTLKSTLVKATPEELEVFNASKQGYDAFVLATKLRIAERNLVTTRRVLEQRVRDVATTKKLVAELEVKLDKLKQTQV